jgi:hypothetical protein
MNCPVANSEVSRDLFLFAAGSGEGDVHLWNDGETQPDSVIKVKDVLKRENATLPYVYDIGDFWQHTILLEKVFNL